MTQGDITHPAEPGGRQGALRPGTATAYVDGDWIVVSGPGTELEDPATGRASGTLAHGDAALVDAAVGAARRAFEAGWGTAPREVRVETLRRLLAALGARKEALADCITREIGSPAGFARSAQVAAALDHLKVTADALDYLTEDAPQTADPAHRVRYEPLGVAALITPWNWPLNQVVLKVGAALGAGCAVVLKPSELSTRTAILFAEAVAEAGLPQGVFNLVPGDGAAGAALVAHPGVDIVSFTGSTGVGRLIAAEAGAALKRTTLELGGKSANILFADCDLETAIRQGVAHCFRNAGQSCNAAARMLVERPVYEAAVALAAREAEAAHAPGDPADPATRMGPLVSRAQFDRVAGLVGAGLDEGLRLAAGGPGRPAGLPERLADGFFARPTVFADVPSSSHLFGTEIFGPVLTMTPFDSEAEAVALANATPYGLAAYVQTADPARADRVARALRAGMVQVNGTSREAGAPFGGRGASGWGREAGAWGIRAFQDVKAVSGAARSG